MGILHDFACLNDTLDLVDQEGADAHCQTTISGSQDQTLGRTYSLSGSGSHFDNWNYLRSVQKHSCHHLERGSRIL
jgi:hypothetical protein